MLELSDREFKTTICFINMLRTLIMGKTDSVQEEMGNVSNRDIYSEK